MPTSSACPLERPQSEPKKQSTNIKNFVHSCHKQKRAKTADGRRYQFKYKGQLPVRPYEPTTHHPLMGVSTHQAMNILVNAAQGFDFPTWSPVVPHYLPKKKNKKGSVSGGSDNLRHFWKTFPLLVRSVFLIEPAVLFFFGGMQGYEKNVQSLLVSSSTGHLNYVIA